MFMKRLLFLALFQPLPLTEKVLILESLAEFKSRYRVALVLQLLMDHMLHLARNQVLFTARDRNLA
jgi:hypothetical protein